MEPQASPTPEQGPIKPAPERPGMPQAPETAPPSQENLSPKGESVSQSAPISPPTSLPKPIVTDDDNNQHDSTKPKVVDDRDIGPPVADDVDVIEKEWVNKAKAIVNEHKHDPYNQEKETSKLQADYLKKRYGKEIKTEP